MTSLSEQPMSSPIHVMHGARMSGAETSVRKYSHREGILDRRAAVITLYLVNSKTSLTLPGVGTGCAAF